MSDKSDTQKLINEFSPQMFCTGLVGMFSNDLYSSVEIKITFNKRRTAETAEAETQHTTADKTPPTRVLRVLKRFFHKTPAREFY